MAAHELQAIADGALDALSGALATDYPGIVLSKGLFRPKWLPAFTNYAVRLAPAGTPWTEVAVGVRYFQRTYRFDLFCLCKVTDEALSLWGQTGDATVGIFQLVQDVKDTLRGNALSGDLLDRTFSEVLGDVALDQSAHPSFETVDRVLVHRARVPYVVRTRPFCVTL